ncbi:bile acid:sodium symporter family protein [Reichenbachiella agarivorans]|uniref:Bile acid:sodium symporter family protein n=1 Tax=Reichenbachiella agarivorans TaxID=2979464 RepID=A0ABY6CZE2_9BACT|nr:bile acid:sodium symporter family protein [Reichenbachiella agarivorans]UXP33600.1 bile acid:sodium symporter family protein [Reichenbachiella agarivorans]
MKESLDHVVLHFSKDSLLLLNICLAFIMFGVALELKFDSFKLLFKTPRPIIVGLVAQLLFLPFLTYLLVIVLEPAPSMALGMMLVAACPGGNVSNFYSSLSKANVALSVSLTALTSSLSFIVTPLSFAFWAQRYEPTAQLLSKVKIDIWDVIMTVVIILVIPLFAGMSFRKKYPLTTHKIYKPIKKLSIIIFGAFVVFALKANFEYFVEYIFNILFIVLIHNLIALGIGLVTSKMARLSDKNQRSVTIETGIQNSGLALVIIFEYFGGLGGMALIAAWWGVWHLISGALISWYWSKRPPNEVVSSLY